MHVQYYVFTIDGNGFIVDTVAIYDSPEEKSIAEVAFDVWRNYSKHNKNLCKAFFVCLDHYGVVQLDVYFRNRAE